MSFWVYKCNAKEHPNHVCSGDWDAVFSRSGSRRWGTTEDIPAFRNLNKGDLVIAYQTDRNELVGLVEVVKMKKRGQFLDVIVQPVEEVRVKLRPLKGIDARVAALSIFKQGNEGTVYPVSTTDAWHLMNVAKAQSLMNRVASPKRRSRSNSA